MTNNKLVFTAVLVLVVIVALYVMSASRPVNDDQREAFMEQTNEGNQDTTSMESANLPTITPVEHASFVLNWGDEVIYFDPVGEIAQYGFQGAPSMIFVTDIHPDHLDLPLLEQLVIEGVTLVVPEAVNAELPPRLQALATVMENGQTQTINEMTIEAVPMYNLPGERENYHVKGRGNGYVLEMGGVRVYNAGDTAGTDEMKAVSGIDIAFVPMNLPYTMDINEAAEAVVAMAPKRVYPFHYRGEGGLSNVEEFKTIVESQNANIEVVLSDWYPTE